MNTGISSNKIAIDENLMETVQHGDRNYPFKYYYENLALFDFNCVEWHWHTELEFVYVESGTVTMWLGEKKFTLPEGNGVFINSRILHRFYSPTEAVIPNFVCMPCFIAPEDSLVYRKYIFPVISSSLAFQTFHKEVQWQEEVLSTMKQIIAAQSRAETCELVTLALMQELWLKLYENLDFVHTKERIDDSAASQARLQLMMQYMHQNYQSNISLEDLSDYVMLSKSTVLNLFRSYLHTTPIKYLINYRLNEAAVLLAKTEKKISTVSDETGFNNVDYFCRLFKKHYQVTPTQYRKKKLLMGDERI